MDGISKVKQFFIRWESVGAHIVGPFESFIRLETAGGILLIGTAAIALLPANCAWVSLYNEILMSLFMTGLSFEDQAIPDKAKLAVLVGSVTSAFIGAALLYRFGPTDGGSAT